MYNSACVFCIDVLIYVYINAVMHYCLGWSIDPGPSADGEVPHYWRVNTRHFFIKKGDL